MGTVVSSLLSDKLTAKFSTQAIVSASVGLTAVGLLGFSFAPTFFALCLFAIPYGLGAGSIDAALNNYVALHYTSRHMSWLHCFWGVGASISPYIMGYAIGAGHGWRNGYSMVSIIQIFLTVILFLSLPLWKRKTVVTPEGEDYEAPISLKDALRIKGVVFVLISFFAYCAFESTAGLWISTYLVENRGMNSETAANFASLFYLGITFGRFLCGFIADKIGDKNMIRIGVATMFVGVVFIALPMNVTIIALIGLMIAGLGAAIEYLEKEGIDNIREKELQHMWHFYNGIKDIPGVKVYGDFDTEVRCPVVTLNIGDYDSSEVSDELLMTYGISTRPGAHCAPLMH